MFYNFDLRAVTIVVAHVIDAQIENVTFVDAAGAQNCNHEIVLTS